MIRATVDTNLFVYVLDSRDAAKQDAARQLIDELRGHDCAVSLQTVGELYSALIRRFKRAPWEAAQASRNVLAAFPTFGATRTAVERALAEAMAGRFSYWDALQLSAANEAGCRICFSEDMEDGAMLGNVEVVHPFGSKGLSDRAHETLARLRR
jgi:predicted nucleic acid-binding protein